MGLLSKARLYYDTVAHLRPVQVASRPLFAARYAAYRAVPGLARAWYPAPPPRDAHRRGPVIALAPGERVPACPGLDEAMARAEAAARGDCVYLSVPGRVSPPVDWAPEERSRLWRYHLHYHDEAVDLGVAYRATGERRFFDAFRALADDWLAHNPVGRGDGWEPYPLSVRVMNWLAALDLFHGCDPAFEERAARSVAHQVLFLVPDHLEEHLLGNHLLKNLCAACVAACAFAGPRWDSLRDWSLELLRHEVHKQVLPDGFHCELTPGYHAIALADLARVACALRDRAPAWLREAISRMTVALRTLLHPDGELPLLGDTAFGQAPPARDLFDEASLLRRLWGGAGLAGAPKDGDVEHGSAGLCVLRRGGEMLLFDAGPIGPDHLAGHGHSDTLGYELSHHGARALVDSGVATYDVGEERDYFRSARAHNVVTVDLEGPDELWAAFRVGRRSRPGPWRVDERGGAKHIRAEVRAYQGWRHVRDLLWDPAAGLAVKDRVYGAAGAAWTHIHLHPSLDARADGDAWAAGDLRIERLQGGAWESFRGHLGPPRRGFYAEKMGAPQPAWELALLAEPGDPAVAAYAVSWVNGWRDRAASMLLELDSAPG